MFSVFDISPIYTFTVFLCFIIFYLSLSFLALMHFYHVFIACSLYSFRYVYYIFISYISYSSTYHLIYHLSNGSYYISYFVHVIFLYLYDFHDYILYHLLCSICIYYYHVLSSCTNFIYCISCYTFHITFSFMYCTCSYTFRVIDTLILVLVYSVILSSHSRAMLLISCHIFSTFYLFYVSCLHKL